MTLSRPSPASQAHANKSNYGEHSPGPSVYNIQESLGANLVGTMQPNSPRYTMRPRLANYQPPGGSPGKEVQPGPGTYNQTTAFGNQIPSSRSTGPL